MAYSPKIDPVIVTVPSDTHTGDTNWTTVGSSSTGSITLITGQYRISLSVELKTSNATAEARCRIYDVTGATDLCGGHTDQTVDDEWRHVSCIVAPGAGSREYRLEMKIDLGAQTATINQAFLTVEKL